MAGIFSQPFPVNTEPLHKLRAAVVAGLVVGLFLYTFKPFGIDEVNTPHSSLFIWGYGLVTTAVLLFLLFVLPVVLPIFFSEERWTVGKNIVFFIFIVAVIGAANFYYTHLAAGLPLSFGAFCAFQLYTASVSLVVASATTFIRYATNLKRYQREAVDVNKEIEEHKHDIQTHQVVDVEPKNETFTIQSENEKDHLILTADAWLYIESADNYSDVCFLQNDLVEHRLIRSSLKRIEENLVQAFAFRCHRSYIINLYKVSQVTGNSQGYKLHLRDSDKPIPVARRLNDDLVERLKSKS